MQRLHQLHVNVLLNPFCTAEYADKNDGQNFDAFTTLEGLEGQFSKDFSADDEPQPLQRLKTGRDFTKIEAIKGTLLEDFDRSGSMTSSVSE